VIARVLVLRNDALKAELASVPEHERAILLLHVLVQPQARRCPHEYGGECRLADFERIKPKRSPG
jgi:hypothetical protein